MKNLSKPSYQIYYMEVSEIKDVGAFLKALNNIESLAHYMSSDPWTKKDLSKKYVCIEVQNYLIRNCYRISVIRDYGLPYTPYDPNELGNLIPLLELKRLLET